MRILARNVIDNQGVKRLSLIDRSNDKLIVVPFDMETSSTCFVDGVVVCLLTESVSTELFSDCLSECVSLNTEILYKWLSQRKALGGVSDPSAEISLYQICSD